MQIQTLLNLLSDSMLGKTIVKFSTELVKNRRFLFLTFLYVVPISIFEQDPTMYLFYFVLEGFVFSLIGFITGMFKMDGVDLFLDYKKDVMNTGAFKATKYTSILSLVFLLGILPAMILGLFFEGSFSFILLIVVRVVFDSIFKKKKTTTAVEGA